MYVPVFYQYSGTSSSPYQDGLRLIPRTYCTSAIFRAMKTQKKYTWYQMEQENSAFSCAFAIEHPVSDAG